MLAVNDGVEAEGLNIEHFWKNAMDDLAGTVESLSGPGSTLAYTESFRKGLEEFLVVSNARSFLDAPCGDFNWMRTVNFPSHVRYFGGDIVRDLVNSHNQNYGSSQRTFSRINIISDPFPDVDIWLCRDCLFHLSFEQALRAIKNSLRARIKYYMFTSNYNETNFDIVAGDFRELNLTIAPFNLPLPIAGIQDYVDGFYPRQVGIWTRDQILGAMVSR